MCLTETDIIVKLNYRDITMGLSAVFSMGIAVSLSRVFSRRGHRVFLPVGARCIAPWATEYIPDSRAENNHRKREKRCKQDQPGILIQSHIVHHFIISISPTSTELSLR